MADETTDRIDDTDRTDDMARADDMERAQDARRRGWHDTDVTSLVFGLLFLGAAATWALVESDVVSWPDASRIFPVLLVVAGLIGLFSSVRRSRRSRRHGDRQLG